MAYAPLAEGRLDEAFGFAIGARRVGTRAKVAEAERLDRLCIAPPDVAERVIGHHGFDVHPERREPRDRVLEGQHRVMGRAGLAQRPRRPSARVVSPPLPESDGVTRHAAA